MTESDEISKSKVQQKKDLKKEAKLAKFAEKQQKQKNDPKVTKKVPKDILKETVIPIKDSTGKKDVNQEMPNTYSPKYVESFWYDWWENSGFFRPEYHDKLPHKNSEKFTMVIPPPNVTGNLHLGHALTNSIEDAIVRWNRMCGRKTLWLPGSDHAGIATQVVVEKKIMREQKITRHELGREKFIEKVWEWKNEKGSRIFDQLRSLGSSCDWSRAKFTMDDDLSKSVTESFVRLHEKGLIYRSNRLVNWSCTLKSAISDIEVDKMELTGKTFLSVPGYEKKVAFGIITSFAYPIIGENTEIIVATTRLETMVGDTGIAVHPKDARYKSLVGKFAQHPFIKDRKIPIVADEMVDMEFGTGAVKLTPAHDQNDWEAGIRNKLEVVNILNEDGTLNENAGEFQGIKRFDARMAIRKALEEKKLLRGDADNPMVVPMCSRTKDIIEPFLKPQWYLKCQNMANRAMDAVKKGDLKICPSAYEKTWFSWLQDCHDWCISRQLWWGHRIPAYVISTRKSTSDENWVKMNPANNESWVTGRTFEEAMEKTKKLLKIKDEQLIKLDQDEDVLDTWFSSKLFPFSTMGWPNENAKDFKEFFPGSLLETGHDILFFWVARMVMASLEFFDKLPFHTIYLHSMVRDAHGKKMSKSLGNAIDPVDVINGISLDELHHQLTIGNLDPRELERAKAAQTADFPSGIPECGTDALRFALCAYVSQGRNINLDILRVQGYRFFCNKLWNATRFALYHCLGENYIPKESLTTLMEPKYYATLSSIDKWILSRCYHCMSKCDEAFKNYLFNEATTSCYNFWLYELCDIYLEYSKPKTKTLVNGEMIMLDNAEANRTRVVLYYCLQLGLAMLHPFMPFITEELFQRLTKGDTKRPISISVSPYPHPKAHKALMNDEAKKAEDSLNFAMSIIKAVRHHLNEYRITGSKLDKCQVQLLFNSLETMNIITEAGLQDHVIEPFLKCKISRMTIKKNEIDSSGCINSTVFTNTDNESSKEDSMNYCIFYLNVLSLVNVEEEVAKLTKKKSQLNSMKETITKEMVKSDYLSKVPLVKRESNDKKLSELNTELVQIEEMMNQYSQISSPAQGATTSNSESKLIELTAKEFGKLTVSSPKEVLNAWMDNCQDSQKSEILQWLRIALIPSTMSGFFNTKEGHDYIMSRIDEITENRAVSASVFSIVQSKDSKICKTISAKYGW